MQIEYIICPEAIEEKLAKKHRVTLREARQALLIIREFALPRKAISRAKMYMLLLVKPLAEDICRYFLSLNQK